MLSKTNLLVLFAVLLASFIATGNCDCCCNQAYKHNWKQCSWNHVNSGTNNGVIRTCPFYKSKADSHLRVVWTGNLRQYLANKCSRWFFTFNGKECSGPLPIDGVIYQSATNNILRVSTIGGYCGKIPAGLVNVEFRVGKCNGYVYGSSYTGWNSHSRIVVEEVNPPQA